MQCKNSKTRIACPIARARGQGLTLLEMVIALAIITVIFAVIVPQFGMILSGWDSRAGAAETIQNGRVLIDHLNRNLSAAVKISAVSDSAETNGYIEFEDNDGNTLRYDIASNYVEFGVVGDLSDLAGPVSALQFTCYDACDLDTPLSPITDANLIRFVKAQTTLTNPAELGQDRTFTAQAYLRTNLAAGAGIGKYTAFEYDTTVGNTPALAQIDSSHYLCAYTGPGNNGWAVVQTVDTGNWSITKETPFEYDTTLGYTPALAQIDSTHYLCAYTGSGSDGWAVVLTVNTGTWAITKETPFEFDTSDGGTPALAKIDSTHYLCAYTGDGKDGWAVVLTVNTGTWAITKETPFEYETTQAKTPALAKIDDSHYLCAYTDKFSDGRAVVLTVNTGNWTITKETPFEYDTDNADTPALTQIDTTHYLCSYNGPASDGWATVLTVDTGTWNITKGTAFEYDTDMGKTPALAQMDSSNYLCAYTGVTGTDTGRSVVLTVDTETWAITKGTPFEYENNTGQTPALAEIDDSHYLCAYDGPEDDGWAVVLNYTSGDDQILP